MAGGDKAVAGNAMGDSRSVRGDRGHERRVGRGDQPRGERRFDVFQLARSAGETSGTLDARQLPRLVDQVLDDRPSTLAYRIQGTRDGRGRPALDIEVEGEIHLVCQRCLLPMTLPLARRALLVVASTQAELEDWDRDESEVALADHPAGAADLVEDEVLLTLPLSPRHESADCAGASRVDLTGGA